MLEGLMPEANEFSFAQCGLGWRCSLRACDDSEVR